MTGIPVHQIYGGWSEADTPHTRSMTSQGNPWNDLNVRLVIAPVRLTRQPCFAPAQPSRGVRLQLP
jgi:hypothetical protein